MTVFQGLVLMLFSLLAAVTLSAAFRGMVRKRIAVMWLAIWTVGAGAIIWPRSTVVVARSLGIGRGADLLLYVSVLLMLVGFFYVYGRFRRLDRQITLLVRRLALDNAERATRDTGGRDAIDPGRSKDPAWSKDLS
jgi:small membrane protein